MSWEDAWEVFMKNTRKRDERIAELTRAGYTAPQIAEMVGVSSRTVQRARVRTGVARDYYAPLTEAEKQRAAALLDDGASYGEVARTIGRDTVSIRKWLPGRSVWTAGSGIEYRRFKAELEMIPPIIEKRPENKGANSAENSGFGSVLPGFSSGNTQKMEDLAG